MTNTEIIMRLLKFCFDGEKFILELADERLSELMTDAMAHQIHPLIYDALQHISDSDILKKYHSHMIATGVMETKTYFEVQKVLDALYEVNINAIAVKGAYLKTLYEVPEHRLMGDVDIVISDDAEYAQAENIFRSRGYDFVATYCNTTDFSKPNAVNFEVHRQLIFGEKRGYSVAGDTLNGYRRVFEEVKDGCILTVDPTTHLLYLIDHMASHFAAGGCGFRQLYDVAIMTRAKQSEIDWERFWSQTSDLRLTSFIANIYKILQQYISLEAVPPHLDEHFENDHSAQLLETLYKSGVFGRKNKTAMYSNLIASGHTKGAYKGKGVFLNLLNTLFPLKLSEKRYVFAQKHPLLLPIAWIDRIFVFLRTRFHLSDIKNVDWKEARKKIRLIEELEL